LEDILTVALLIFEFVNGAINEHSAQYGAPQRAATTKSIIDLSSSFDLASGGTDDANASNADNPSSSPSTTNKDTNSSQKQPDLRNVKTESQTNRQQSPVIRFVVLPSSVPCPPHAD
jgi:hypothetical protein